MAPLLKTFTLTRIVIHSRWHTYRVASDDLGEEVGEVLGREATFVALQVQPLHRCGNAAGRDHGGRARDEVDI